MEQKRSITVHGGEYSSHDQCNIENLSQHAEKDTEAPNSKRKRNKKSAKTINQDGEDNDVPVILSFEGKKKRNKSKKSFSSFSALSLDEEDNDENDSRMEIVDAGGNVEIDFVKKKSKMDGGNKFTLDLGEEVEIASNKHMDDEKEDESVELDFDFGKKKKSKKKKGVKFAAELENEKDDDSSEISHTANIRDSVRNEKDVGFDFGRKTKLNKKEKNEKSPQEEEDLDKLLAELGESKKPEEKAPVVEEAKESETELKNQKKKKRTKKGRTVEEEDDLDKLLAELGGPTPSSSTAAQPAEIVEKADKEPNSTDMVETAAAKKKKKKKEKEKEKRAAAKKEEVDEVKVEAAVKGKAVDNKKIPKHVREKQEALARRKEEESRRKREEEERLRKEEEERRRLEELERIAEEARRRKKEREKEKLLKKKQEGKLLTAKQKEEQSRLEAMRNQFLSQNNGVRGDAPNQVKKKPKYKTKKSKNAMNKESKGSQQVIETETEQVSEETNNTADEVNEVEGKLKERNLEKVEAIEDEDDDGEWDAKSWDAVEIVLPTTNPFAEDDKYEKDEAQLNLSKKSIGSKDSAQKHAAAPTASAKRVEKPQEVKKKSEVANGKADVNASDDKSNATSRHELRSPICCILGHVDAGKTKLLDCIRRTNVQESEAGGITQQIGATYFPIENIRERTKELKADATLKVPGLLVIDTPGHESFANLRSRGSSLCDFAVLVVDIMHGLKPQTIESLNLLKSQNTEFIVALNKVDRLNNWKHHPNAPIIKAIKKQSEDVKHEFNTRLVQIVTQFKEQGLNTALYYRNKEMGEIFNIVPTSAISGEGIPDLLLLLIQRAQKTMEDKLTYQDEVECTVLEVKVIEGLGTTIDVVLVNGILHKGDQIVVCGTQGPIVTNVRDLLTPQPMKELRVKGAYQHHTEIKAAQGIKISAQGLEHAVAGTALYVVRSDDDLEEIKDTVMQDMNKVMSRIDKSGEGVYVQASTLGSLEALTVFLKSPDVNIPFCDFSIGPVHRKDVMKASVMSGRGKREYATILAFDVKIMPDARDLANNTDVKIFEADIIYHLFDQFKAYLDNLREEKKRQSAEEAVFPCVLKQNSVIRYKDPIMLGVDVCEGTLKVGTPICIPSRDFIDIGRIKSIEINGNGVNRATKGQEVSIKIERSNPEEKQRIFGRHFNKDDELVSHITRKSIDVLKADHWGDLSNEEQELLLKLELIFKRL